MIAEKKLGVNIRDALTPVFCGKIKMDKINATLEVACTLLNVTALKIHVKIRVFSMVEA